MGVVVAAALVVLFALALVGMFGASILLEGRRKSKYKSRGAQVVPAHDRHEGHRYWVHFPEHPARKGDPHYVDFDHYHRKHRATARCYVGERIGFQDCRDAQGVPCPAPGDGGQQRGLELHHHVIEFSLQNGVSFNALEVDYPGISDKTTVGGWVESDANFRWLCVLPGSPVLMADGTWRAIEDVAPGEWVIGGDGRPDQVLATSRKRYRGEVVSVGPAALTPSHRVATDRGWVPAGQVAEQIGVFGPDVVRLRCVQEEVGSSVVCPVPVDVVDSLLWEEGATHQALRDEPMLHDEPLAIPYAGVAAGGGLWSSVTHVPLQKGVESHQPAGVRAGMAGARLPVRPGVEDPLADLANKHRALGWLTVDHPVRTLHTGWVHDLSVAHSHSFVVGGLVVHNCAFHHRGAAGAHTASHSDWSAGCYVPGLISATPASAGVEGQPWGETGETAH